MSRFRQTIALSSLTLVGFGCSSCVWGPCGPMLAPPRVSQTINIPPAEKREAWQARYWPEVTDASSLAKFAEKKCAMRERYLSQDRKLDFAFLPEKEWPKAIADMKPQAVLVERGYLVIALVLGDQFTQAIAVVVDDAAFKKDAPHWTIEATADERIKRLFSHPK